MDDERNITLAILAGGEGSRMGKPKGLLTVNGRPILEYLLERLSWVGPTMLVTSPGRERPPGAARFTREASDPTPGVGPLRGVLTALENTQTPLVVVTAVDMPLVESLHLRKLVDEIRARPAFLGLMTRHSDTSPPRSRLEPFPGIFHIDAAAVMRERLESRQFSVAGLTRDPRFAAIELPWDPSVWLNINSTADMEQLQLRGLRLA